MSQKIVVIGAGYAGVLATKKLDRRLKKEDVEITIIDRNSYHTMLTELHEVAANRVPEDHVRISIKKIFAERRVKVVLDNIQTVDYDKKTVVGEVGNYEYDYLVVACGSKPTFFGTPGAEENAYYLWSYDDAVWLKHHIVEVFKDAASETNQELRKQLLTFYVVGAGFTGAEMVGELAEWIPALCAEHEIDRKDVRVVNVDMLDRVVPTFPERLSVKVEKRLRKMGVEVRLKTGVAAVAKDHIELKQGDTIISDPTSTVIWTAGVEGAEVVSRLKDLKQMGRKRLQTDEYLRAEGRSDIYVAGDNIFHLPENQAMPVPQMVENAEQSAEVVAHNLVAAITGKGEPEKYMPQFHGAMLSVGGRYGTAYVGTDKKKIALPSFPAMFVKHLINLVYFVQVAGWNKVIHYLRNEFFAIRHCRSFVGGHFSNRTPSFMLVAFRVWLGAVWAFEGVMKVVEGWLREPKLEGFFGGASSWFDGILKSGGGYEVSEAVDAVSSATAVGGGEAGSSAGTVLLNFDFLGLFKAIFVSGKPLAESTISDLAFKMDIPLVNAFVSNIVLGYPSITLGMQTVIVIAEILIGLSLMAGLFTTLSALASIALLFMFMSTTGLFLSSFWMLFGAIAMLFGAGKIFGLDYYVSPLLKKSWAKIPWVRRSYLYHD